MYHVFLNTVSTVAQKNVSKHKSTVYTKYTDLNKIYVADIHYLLRSKWNLGTHKVTYMYYTEGISKHNNNLRL